MSMIAIPVALFNNATFSGTFPDENLRLHGNAATSATQQLKSVMLCSHATIQCISVATTLSAGSIHLLPLQREPS
jgi:hypothetical protein